jgi:protein-disulfide isomerase
MKPMIWTILILLAAIALYASGWKLMTLVGKGKKEPTMAAFCVLKTAKIVAIILLVIGVNRLGLGTTYYLTQKNPMILQTMAQNMQAQNQAGTSKEITKYIKKHGDEMAKHAPIIGNVDAKKTIYFFTSYSCPYCTRAHNELNRVLESHSDVRVVIKNFSIHGVLSDDAARAMIAARMQGDDKAAALDKALSEKKYWPDDLQGKSQEELAKTVHKAVMDRAQKVGLNVAQLQEDMKGEIVNAELAQVRELAQRFEIGGTPFLIVNGTAFPGAVPYDTIVKALR